MACFVTPGANSEYGPAQAVRERARDLLDLPFELGVDDEGNAGGLGDELDRTVVVGRAEAARDEHQVSGEPLREGRPQVVGTVTHDRDPLRLDPEP